MPKRFVVSHGIKSSFALFLSRGRKKGRKESSDVGSTSIRWNALTPKRFDSRRRKNERRNTKKRERERYKRERRGREWKRGPREWWLGALAIEDGKWAREKEDTGEEEREDLWKHVEIRGTLRPDQRHENLARASLPADRPHSLPTRFPRTRTLSACPFRRAPLYLRARLYRQPRLPLTALPPSKPPFR